MPVCEGTGLGGALQLVIGRRMFTMRRDKDYEIYFSIPDLASPRTSNLVSERPDNMVRSKSLFHDGYAKTYLRFVVGQFRHKASLASLELYAIHAWPNQDWAHQFAHSSTCAVQTHI